MATKKYKSTVEVCVWKEQTCLGCGSAFQYLFKRSLSATADSPSTAQRVH